MLGLGLFSIVYATYHLMSENAQKYNWSKFNWAFLCKYKFWLKPICVFIPCPKGHGNGYFLTIFF
jgi:hypothetical protein